MNLNVHFHMLVPDGGHLADTQPPVFRQHRCRRRRRSSNCSSSESQNASQKLERAGLLARDCDNSFLTLATDAAGPMDDLLSHSITYRVAMGPRAGQEVFTLPTVPVQLEEEQKKGVAQYAGFSLHAGTSVEAEQTGKIERLVRYVSRPALPRNGSRSRSAATFGYN